MNQKELYSSPKAWIPPAYEPSSQIGYWGAVRVPKNKTAIATYTEYLELLEARVEQTIRQSLEQSNNETTYRNEPSLMLLSEFSGIGNFLAGFVIMVIEA